MKILISSLYFYPDHSGIALYSTDFAKFMAEKGHEVNVVTGFSFYPNWAKKEADKGKLFRKDIWGNIKIYRGYIFVPKKVNTFSRILQEISFVLFSLINFIRIGKPDATVIFTTPISIGFIGSVFNRIFNSILIINIQDLQLEAAKSLDMFKLKWVFKIIEKLEKLSYKNSNKIASISDGMINLIRKKGVDESKIIYWPNWIDVDASTSYGTEGSFLAKHPEFKNKILIAYTGNVGVKQGLSILIDIAEKLSSKEELHFLIVGSGGDITHLKEYAKTKQIQNFTFLPFLNQVDYFDFLVDCDIIFISQLKTEGDIYFPSKLLGLCSKSKLMIVSADIQSELYKVVEKNEIGFAVDYGDIDRIVNFLKQYEKNSETIKKIKTNAYNFVKQYDRQVVLNNVLTEIQKLTEKK